MKKLDPYGGSFDMYEENTHDLTVEQELERHKRWLKDLNIRYNELKKVMKEQEICAELEELKKDITRFLYLQTGRIPFTGKFTQSFIIENKPHPLAHESAVECNLKREYKELKEKLKGLGDKDE